MPEDRSPSRNLAVLSPVAAVLFSGAVGLLSFLVTDEFYLDVLNEASYASGNVAMLAFMTLCIATFAFGYALYSRFFTRWRHPTRAALERRGSETYAVTVALALVILGGGTVAVATTLGSFSLTSLLAVLSGDANSLILRRSTNDLLSETNLRWVVVATQAITPWMLWMAAIAIPEGQRTRRRTMRVLIALVGVVSLLLLLLSQNRGPAILYLLTFALTGLLIRWHQNRLDIGRVTRYLLIAVGVSILYFAVVQISRTTGTTAANLDFVYEKAAGYYLGSYNRFGAIVDGQLELPGQGKGYYWTQWLWEFPVIGDRLALRELAQISLGSLPVSGAAERTALVAGAGLTFNLTAMTIFAHSLIDFGWFGWFPFLLYGALAGLVWDLFRRGSPFGIMLYPFMLWSILEWRGYIEITRTSIPIAVAIPFLFWLAVKILAAIPTISVRGRSAPPLRHRSPSEGSSRP